MDASTFLSLEPIVQVALIVAVAWVITAFLRG